VFAPLAYRTIGSENPVAHLPISTCATQWFTPTSGTPRAIERARAAVATVRSDGPSPGPCEKATARIRPGSASTRETTSFIAEAWCCAASRGWIPPFGGT